MHDKILKNNKLEQTEQLPFLLIFRTEGSGYVKQGGYYDSREQTLKQGNVSSSLATQSHLPTHSRDDSGNEFIDDERYDYDD